MYALPSPKPASKLSSMCAILSWWCHQKIYLQSHLWMEDGSMTTGQCKCKSHFVMLLFWTGQARRELSSKIWCEGSLLAHTFNTTTSRQLSNMMVPADKPSLNKYIMYQLNWGIWLEKRWHSWQCNKLETCYVSYTDSVKTPSAGLS